MAKYLRKFNKETNKWEVLSPNYSSDIYVTNPSISQTSDGPKNLDTVITSINDDITKLKRNVSWLAEHGGGGGGGIGGGIGSSTEYKFHITTAGVMNDTIYVQEMPFTVNFKINGGSVKDKVSYQVYYNGKSLTNGFKEVNANSNQSVVLPSFGDGNTNSLHFEGFDSNGIAINDYTLTIIESSIKIDLNTNIFQFNIIDEPSISVNVTNKIINAETELIVKNIKHGREKKFNYKTSTTNKEAFQFGLCTGKNDEDKLLLKNNIEVNTKYTFSVIAKTTTITNSIIESSELFFDVWFVSSDAYTIVVNGIKSIDDLSLPTEHELNSNLLINYAIYHNTLATAYYSIVLSSESGDTRLDTDLDIYGDYYATTKEGLEEYIGDEAKILNTNVSYTEQTKIENNNIYLGEKFLKIKCWSTDFAVSASFIGVVKIIQSNLDVFNVQKPTRSNEQGSGHTCFFDFDVFSSVAGCKPPTDSNAKTWESKQSGYAGVILENGQIAPAVWAPIVKLNLVNTNGIQSGFVIKGYNKVMRFQGDSYGVIESPFNDGISKSLITSHNAFTLSVGFKSDNHPTNENTIFEWGSRDESGSLKEGILITLEKIIWKVKSYDSNGYSKISTLSINIQQNTPIVVDFVYHSSDTTYENDRGLAKIFVNGVINAATEVNKINCDFVENKDIYIAASNVNGVISNFSDIDVYSIRFFTHPLTDIEILINSHDTLAERKETGLIDEEKYKSWKNKNLLVQDPNTNIINSVLYDNNNRKYISPTYNDIVKNNPPLPIVYIDATDANSNGKYFTSDFFFTSYIDSSVTGETFNGCTLTYYDNVKQTYVEATNVSISLQGTSSTIYRSKNIEIYFKQECQEYNDGRTQLFQPKDTWFPESQFTLKADVVDSAHANNAVLGGWINKLSESIMEKSPGASFNEYNPPKDKVVLNGETIDKNDGENDSWANQTTQKVKNTLEGFSILLLIRFAQTDKDELLGIYSFNLGRFSFYNLGLKFFKYFSRRILNITNNKFEEPGCPAIVNYYDFYRNTETLKFPDGSDFYPNRCVSFEFGAEADDNTKDHPTWSQDDMDIVGRCGKFRFNGANDDPIQEIYPSTTNAWHNLQYLFTLTSACYPTYKKYKFSNGEFIKELDTNGEHSSYNPGGDQTYQQLTKSLCIKNCMSYFVICSVFGMVDSLSKNLTLRSWNCNLKDRVNTVWYPCFYDMDTALGLTNDGEEIVNYDDFVDRYTNTGIIYEDNGKSALSTNGLKVDANFDSPEFQNKYGGYNSKLWRILRKKSETSLSEVWSSDENGSDFFKRSQYNGDYYENIYAKLRNDEDGLLKNADKFIEDFIVQTENCGEIIFNQNYFTKYLVKYNHKDSSGNDITDYGNISMLHGNRREYVRSWLNNRLLFLDGVFEVDLYGVKTTPMSKIGTISIGGNPSISSYPIFRIKTTNPTFLTANVGSSDNIEATCRYYLKSYNEIDIAFPAVTSQKQVSFGSTPIISKFDNLKDYKLNKFNENLSLPKLTHIDFSNIKTFYGKDPVDFCKAFTFNSGLFDTNGNLLYTSNVREINMRNVGQVSTDNKEIEFAVVLNKQAQSNDKKIYYNFDKLKKINVSNSSITQLLLPTSVLEELDIVNSNLTELILKSQPLLNTINVSRCIKLQNIEINLCSNIKKLELNNLPELTSVTISACNNLETLSISGNPKLTLIDVDVCDKLKTLNISNNTNTNLKIQIISCTNLVSFTATNLKTDKKLILPISLPNLETFNVSNWDGLTEIQYGSNSLTTYSNYDSNIGGTHINYTDNENPYKVLDLSPMTKITSMTKLNSGYYSGLTKSTMNVDGCAQIKCIKFRNDASKPFICSKKNGFRGCVNLFRVFGHVVLNGNGDFNGLEKFRIHSTEEYNAKVVNNCVQHDSDDFRIFKENTTENGGFVTNLRLTSSISQNLSNTFNDTSCTLYDAYYMLYKCNTSGNTIVNKDGEEYFLSGKTEQDNIKFTSIQYVFSECEKIVFSEKNNLNRNAYKNCEVNGGAFVNPFYGCSGNTSILYYSSNGDEIGTLTTPLISATSLSEINGYGDENIFSIGEKESKIKTISFTSIKFIEDAKTYKENYSGMTCNAKARNLLKDLTKLEYIYHSFNNFKIIFNDEEKCGLFNGVTNLSAITNSFKGLSSKSDTTNSINEIKHLFGEGVSGENYPNKISSLIDSFNLDDDSNARLFIGNSFFKNISSTIVKVENCFNNFQKYIFNDDVDPSLKFPYKVLAGCSKLQVLTHFFSKLNSMGESIEITLPTYNENGVSKSMFDDCISLSDISYLFYNLGNKSKNNITYSLTGFGFKNCNLQKVNYCFAYESNNYENTISNRKGTIPYGLFYKEEIKVKAPLKGLTKEIADYYGINESFGIKNPKVDDNGRVIKEPEFYENDTNEKGLPKIKHGGTYGDNNFNYYILDTNNDTISSMTFNYKTDDYGLILDGIDGVGNEEEDNICTVNEELLTTFTHEYSSVATTITEMEGCFSYSDGVDLECYDISDNIDEKLLIVDNENYNDIYLIVNPNYNPILYKRKYNIFTYKYSYEYNNNYDPRRYVINESYNKYRKKANKYYHDGITDCSEIFNKYEEVLDPDSKNSFNIHSNRIVDVEKFIFKDIKNNPLFGIRKYAFAPDLLCYCSNKSDLNINNLFMGSGGKQINNYKSSESSKMSYINYGIRGTIPSYMFDMLTNLQTANYIFYGCTTLLPDSWGYISGSTLIEGNILPKDLFKNNTKLINLEGTFGGMVFYPGTYLNKETFVKSITVMRSCFEYTAWLGGVSVNCPYENDINQQSLINPSYTSSTVSNYQLKNNPFENITALSVVNRMFYGGIQSGSRNMIRDLWLLSTDIFANNKSLTQVEEVFGLCYSLKTEDNDLIRFASNDFPNMENLLKCYSGCEALKTQLKANNEELYNQYEQYFTTS